MAKMTNQQKIDKIEKIFIALNEAIEDKDVAKVEEIVTTKLGKFNKMTEGELTEPILGKLTEKIKKISEEMKPENGLDTDEIAELIDIRKAIIKGKEPFQKTDDVVKNLMKKNIKQEDLIAYKERQKEDNAAQIEGIKAVNKDLATGIADIELRYIEPIRKNQEMIKTIEKMQKNKQALTSLDPTMDADRINATKSEIRATITELSAKGIDTTSLANFETNLNSIDTFVSTNVADLKAKSDTIASTMAKDTFLPDKLRKQFDLKSIKDVKQMEQKYKEMVGVRQSNATKIVTLSNENVQIDNTVAQMQKEEVAKEYTYNDEGNLKSDEEIASEVLADPDRRKNVNLVVDSKFSNPKNRLFFPKLRNKIDYFKEADNCGWLEAFGKAFIHTTRRTKQLAVTTEATKMGKTMYVPTAQNMEKRTNSFKETIKKEALKKLSKDSTLTEADLQDEIYKKAFDKSTTKDINSDSGR